MRKTRLSIGADPTTLVSHASFAYHNIVSIIDMVHV